MYFHIIGIKEVQNKKYNMDIVLQWESETFIRKFLHSHNIVLLEISEYKDDLDSFGKLELIVEYKQKNIQTISYLTDIEIAAYTFMMIGFTIIYINFLWESKLSDYQVQEIINKSSIKIEESQKNITQILKQEKDKEKRIYKDDNLEKILQISQNTFKEKDALISLVWDNVSKDKIRDLNIMLQNLTKLKMWRNVDKMSELLEAIYHKSYEIQQEYLSNCNIPVVFPILWSIVTNIDMISETNKFTKAQKIKKIWAKRDSDDNYYLSFEFTWVYLKLLFKDIKNSIKNIKYLFYNMFDYLQLLFLSIIVFLSLNFRFHKISYSIDENIYLYVFMIKMWIFWLCFYIFSRFKRINIYQNIWLILLVILLSYVVFWLLRSNFSF